MQEITKQLKDLAEAIDAAAGQLQLPALIEQIEILRTESQAPEFWNDSQRAQETMKRLSKLEQRTLPWEKLQTAAHELLELAELDDPSLEKEITTQYAPIKKEFDERKRELLYSGPYDDHDAILSLAAGAGGTEAQDWTGMLLRMYTRWAEANKYKITMLDESPGEEAGLKSVTLEVEGPFAYAKLKGEHGTHRLVRLSPFNADNLRQTSFAKAEVVPKIDTPDEVEVDEKDLKIDVYRSGGKGGQSVNTTDSAVRITHIPTGIVVAIQNERSQLQNRETAMTLLRSKLAQLQLEQHAQAVSELKGPNEQAAWGNQIRSYVLHPYTMVKDLRTRHETSEAAKVLDGDLNPFIDAYLEHTITDNQPL